MSADSEFETDCDKTNSVIAKLWQEPTLATRRSQELAQVVCCHASFSTCPIDDCRK